MHITYWHVNIMSFTRLPLAVPGHFGTLVEVRRLLCCTRFPNGPIIGAPPPSMRVSVRGYDIIILPQDTCLRCALPSSAQDVVAFASRCSAHDTLDVRGSDSVAFEFSR